MISASASISPKSHWKYTTTITTVVRGKPFLRIPEESISFVFFTGRKNARYGFKVCVSVLWVHQDIDNCVDTVGYPVQYMCQQEAVRVFNVNVIEMGKWCWDAADYCDDNYYVDGCHYTCVTSTG